MCGHATIALGRFLVDTRDTLVFPRRDDIVNNHDNHTVTLTLHAPCGPVLISVPVVSTGSSSVKSDPSRPVSFLSVPSFMTGADIVAQIPNQYLWKKLASASTTTEARFDIAFGGAYYAIITVDQLGFTPAIPIVDALRNGTYTLPELKEATRLLKAFLVETPEFQKYLRHPTSPELEYLYGVIVVDPIACNSSQDRSNTGVCFFADQQVDRSPCGSGVCARTALANLKRDLSLYDSWTYHSLVTKAKGEGPFIGRAIEEVTIEHDGRYIDKDTPWRAYIVEVSGYAYYTDAATFILEEGDNIGAEGFVL